LLHSRKRQYDRLRDLFQVVGGDSTLQDDKPNMDCDLKVAQRSESRRSQYAFNAFGQAEIRKTLLEEPGAHLERVFFRVTARLHGQYQESGGSAHGASLLLIR